MKRKTLVTLATFCCLLAAAIIFISCGHHHDDSTDATSGCTQIANVTKIYLFGSTDEHDGNLGGRTGADALLDADGNKPVACTTATHAFISVDANDSIANMPTTYCFPDNIKIYAPDGITIIADNWAALMDSSIDVSLRERNVRSTTETSGVETRKAIPVSFPLVAGRTSPTAFAAPVLDGMMLIAAARPPRQSFFEGPSTVF